MIARSPSRPLMLMKLIYDVSPCAPHLHHVSPHSRTRGVQRFCPDFSPQFCLLSIFLPILFWDQFFLPNLFFNCSLFVIYCHFFLRQPYCCLLLMKKPTNVTNLESKPQAIDRRAQESRGRRPRRPFYVEALVPPVGS